MKTPSNSEVYSLLGSPTKILSLEVANDNSVVCFLPEYFLCLHKHTLQNGIKNCIIVLQRAFFSLDDISTSFHVSIYKIYLKNVRNRYVILL